MNCKILDDEEIQNAEEKQKNFRKWSIDDIDRRPFPFDRYQKKEFPFLFKKKPYYREDNKISLDEIITKVKDLSMNSPILNSIQENINVPTIDLDYESNTPPYPPEPLTPHYTPETLKSCEHIPDLKLDDIQLEDGKK